MSTDETNYFLLIYDIPSRSVEVEEFGANEDAASARYSELEAEHFKSADYDIVLLGASSLEVIKTTHSSYFDDAVSDDLAAPASLRHFASSMLLPSR